jgi:hypothetical protein
MALAALEMADAAQERMLPPSLQAWRAANPLPPFQNAIATVALLAVVVGSIGLLARRRWAAHVHLGATLLWAALAFSIGPGVATGVCTLFATLLLLAAGFIYGLAFFTDALAPRDDGSPSDRVN